MQRCAIVIPARRGSTRFFNKPLAKLCGQTVIERTWRLACAAVGTQAVTVATDCPTIADHVQQLGGRAWLDDTAVTTGTERVALASLALPDDVEVVLNLQGDAVLTPPQVMVKTLELLLRPAEPGRPGFDITTAATPLSSAERTELAQRKAQGAASGTTVVLTKFDQAMYFSRAVLPAQRSVPQHGPHAFRHVGLYAFRRAQLAHIAALQPTQLEAAEGLEQLRWMEHGLSVGVARVDLGGRALWSIDYPEDLEMAAQIIARQGELLPA